MPPQTNHLLVSIGDARGRDLLSLPCIHSLSSSPTQLGLQQRHISSQQKKKYKTKTKQKRKQTIKSCSMSLTSISGSVKNKNPKMRLSPPSSPALQRQKKIFFPLQNQNSVSTKQLLMTPTLISIFPASGPRFSSCPHIRCHPAGVFTVKTTPSCRGAVQGCGPRVGAGGCGCRWVCTRQPPRQLPAGGCPRSRPAFGAAKAARTSTAATGASSLLAQNTAHGKDGAFPPRPRTIQPRGRASHKADSSTAPARSGFIHPLLCCRRAVDSQRRSPPSPRTLPPRSPPYPLADAGERSRSPRAAAGCSRWQAAAVPLPAAEPSREGGSSGAARSGGGGGR